MSLNQRLWSRLPGPVIDLNVTRRYGNFLHAIAQFQSTRGQLFHTFFLRNRAALELIRRLVEQRAESETLRIAVLGCSTGAEAYSIAWRIRSVRSDLKLVFYAMDISPDAVQIAESGAYSARSSQFAGSDMFDLMTDFEISQLFDRKEDMFLIKSWIKEGIHWRVGDAADTKLFNMLGPQDIVVANNFLCHMNKQAAEQCLLNIARLVVPRGYLFVSGIDLDVRTKVVEKLGLKPVHELLEDIHEGDPRMGTSWPFNYAALEPLDKRRRDWKTRYAAVFQSPALVRSANEPNIE